MKINAISYFVSLGVFFLLITLLNHWFSPIYITFWLAGIIGIILPDIDQLIYIYYLKPHELSSVRADRIIKTSNLRQAADFIGSTHEERKHLIFHTAVFQIVFLVFTFLVVSSSNSLIGKGLVLGFSLHLVIDQLIDLLRTNSLSRWFINININLSKEQATFYWLANLLIIILFGFTL